MPIYLQGITLTTNAAITNLKESNKFAVAKHSTYGSDVVEVEIISKSEHTINFTMLLRKEDTLNQEQVEFVVNNIQGAVDRLTPLLLHCDEHPILGGSRDVFIVVDSFDVDYQAGTVDTNMYAIVTFSASILGTPKNLLGVYAVTSQRRKGDYTGVVAGRSTIGLPYYSGVFYVNANVPILESRNGTVMMDLGDPDDGFCDDTAGQVAEDVDTGEVKFNIEVTNNNFVQNAIKVYDAGYSPRKRVLSKNHEFLGNIVVESELYKVEVQMETSRVDLYAAPTTAFVYNASAFENLVLQGFNSAILTINTDEMVRIKFSSGDYLEIERGKDPVFSLNNNDSGFSFLLGSSSSLATTSVQNWVSLGSNVYLCSNYQFTSNNRVVGPVTSDLTEQVYSIIYYTGSFASSGRNKEILKEIS